LLWLAMQGNIIEDGRPKSTQYFATKDYLAGLIGVSVNTANRYIRALRSTGWLSANGDACVQTWDLHSLPTGEDEVPTRESPHAQET